MAELPPGLLGITAYEPYDEDAEKLIAIIMLASLPASPPHAGLFGGAYEYPQWKMFHDLIDYALSHRISLKHNTWRSYVLEKIAAQHFANLAQKRKRGGQRKKPLGLLSWMFAKSELLNEVKETAELLQKAGRKATDTEVARQLVADKKYPGREPDDLESDEVLADEYITAVKSMQVSISRVRRKAGEMKHKTVSLSIRKKLKNQHSRRRS